MENHGEVYQDCKHCSAQWDMIGLNLGVSSSTIAIINRDNHDSCERCMLQMLTKWLQKENEKCVPSWRSLCQALWDIDRSTAILIAEKHHVIDSMKQKGIELQFNKVYPGIINYVIISIMFTSCLTRD